MSKIDYVEGKRNSIHTKSKKRQWHLEQIRYHTAKADAFGAEISKDEKTLSKIESLMVERSRLSDNRAYFLASVRDWAKQENPEETLEKLSKMDKAIEALDGQIRTLYYGK